MELFDAAANRWNHHKIGVRRHDG